MSQIYKFKPAQKSNASTSQSEISNRIPRSYLETPSWELTLRGISQLIKNYALPLGNDQVQLPVEIATPNVIYKSFRVHNWRSKKFVNIQNFKKYTLNTLRLNDLQLIQARYVRLKSALFKKEIDRNLDYLNSYFIDLQDSLQSLSLDLKSREITDKNLKSLGFLISHCLSNLTKLKIDNIHSEHVTDKGVQSLFSQICRYLIKLKFLHISFIRCLGISENATISLVHVFKNMKNLQGLNLSFHDLSQITDNGMKAIADCIEHHLSGLQRISLDFSKCNNITDAGFQTIQNAITTHLSNLTHLKLDFSSCPNFTDKNLDQLILSKLPRLRRFSLIIQGNPSKITGRGFTQLILKELRHLRNLEQLEFNFYKNYNFTETALKTFFLQPDNFFESLTELLLRFTLRQGITDDSLDMIIGNIQSKMTNLKDFGLFLHGSRLSIDKKEEVKKALHYIPKLDIHF